MIETCPSCKKNLTYAVEGQKYSKVIGVEVPQVYDGTLFWQCPSCKHEWPRFTPGTRLYDVAILEIAGS